MVTAASSPAFPRWEGTRTAICWRSFAVDLSSMWRLGRGGAPAGARTGVAGSAVVAPAVEARFLAPRDHPRVRGSSGSTTIHSQVPDLSWIVRRLTGTSLVRPVLPAVTAESVLFPTAPVVPRRRSVIE